MLSFFPLFQHTPSKQHFNRSKEGQPCDPSAGTDGITRAQSPVPDVSQTGRCPRCGDSPCLSQVRSPLDVEGQAWQFALGSAICTSKALTSEANCSQPPSDVGAGMGASVLQMLFAACNERQSRRGKDVVRRLTQGQPGFMRTCYTRGPHMCMQAHIQISPFIKDT